MRAKTILCSYRRRTGYEMLCSINPLPPPVDALRNPRWEIRLAGLLALIERPDHPATAQLLAMSLNEKDPYLRAEINRVLWAIKVVQMAEVQLQRAASALSAGNIRRARRILNNIHGFYDFSAKDYEEILKVGLSTRKPGHKLFLPFYILEEAFSPTVDRFAIQDSEIGVKEDGSVRLLPGKREMIATDPYFDS